jgi:hypothetical protein
LFGSRRLCFRFRRSLLPLLQPPEPTAWPDVAYASHSFHNLYCYYPTRAVSARVNGTQFHLVHNLNYNLDFGALLVAADRSSLSSSGVSVALHLLLGFDALHCNAEHHGRALSAQFHPFPSRDVSDVTGRIW